MTTTWRTISSQVTKMVNLWSGRNDLIAVVQNHENKPPKHAALFQPTRAEIIISTEVFGKTIKEEKIGDFTERKTQYEFPTATGAALHEAFHARFSQWSLEKIYEDLQADEAEILTLLEETRIEKQGLELNPKNKVFLRESALNLALKDFEESQLETLTTHTASSLFALIQGRVVAGILEQEEVQTISTAIQEKLGEPIYNRFTEIIEQTQNHTHHHTMQPIYPLVREWAQLLKERAEENKEQDSQQTSQNIKQMLEEAAKTISVENIEVLFDQQQIEQAKELSETLKSKKEQTKQNITVAQKVFGKESGIGRNRTSSEIVEQRKPKSAERSAAVIISRQLDKAKYRERDLTIIKNTIPPGKLKTTAAIHNEALRNQGLLPTAREWKQKVRKHTDEPALNVGVMVDISGSMREAMQPMATTAWVLSEAVRRVQGKLAMVYYGEDVIPAVKPGQHLTEVTVRSATDSTEQFDKAFKALDGALNLFDGVGANLVVIVSDGRYTHDEQAAATRWVSECHRNGVGVLWITFEPSPSRRIEDICKGTNTVVLSNIRKPEEVALTIGEAAVRAVENK